MCFSQPQPLIKMNIASNQCGHYNQVKPFKNPCVRVMFQTNLQALIVFIPCEPQYETS